MTPAVSALTPSPLFPFSAELNTSEFLLLQPGPLDFRRRLSIPGCRAGSRSFPRRLRASFGGCFYGRAHDLRIWTAGVVFSEIDRHWASLLLDGAFPLFTTSLFSSQRPHRCGRFPRQFLILLLGLLTFFFFAFCLIVKWDILF